MTPDPRVEPLRRSFDWPAIVHDLAHLPIVLDSEIEEVLGPGGGWRGATPDETERFIAVLTSHYRPGAPVEHDVRCELCGVPVGAPPQDPSRDVLCPECAETIESRLARGDPMAWRERLYAELLDQPICRRGLGLLLWWRTPDAPEAERIAKAAAHVVARTLAGQRWR